MYPAAWCPPGLAQQGCRAALSSAQTARLQVGSEQQRCTGKCLTDILGCWAGLAWFYNFYHWSSGRNSKTYSRIQTLLVLIHRAGTEERAALSTSSQTWCSQTLTNCCIFKPNLCSTEAFIGEWMLPENPSAGWKSNVVLQMWHWAPASTVTSWAPAHTRCLITSTSLRRHARNMMF